MFLHGTGGLAGHEEFLAALAHDGFSVHAPELPGFGESTGEQSLRTMLDVTLHSWDVIDALGLERPVLVGHSMGGMIAAEMACVSPERVEDLVLMAPLGLWLDAHPIPDLFATLPHDMPALLFHDPALGAARLTGGVDFSDTDALVDFIVRNGRRLGTAGKLLFPVPDRGLADRLYRLRARTALVWGDDDHLVGTAYAEHWRNSIPGSALHVVADTGHALIQERPAGAAAAVIEGLARDPEPSHRGSP